MRSPMRLDLPGSPARRDRTPRRVSDCLFSWHAASATLDSDQGVTGVFARAATLASVSDGAGSTYTAPHSLPAWEMRDLDGDGAPGTPSDYGVFLGSFGKSKGQPGFNAQADLDSDGAVTSTDWSLLVKFCPLGR
jgi:hypothetical protein